MKTLASVLAVVATLTWGMDAAAQAASGGGGGS